MEVLVADLRKAEPRGALCGPAKGGWSAVPYEAEGISGHMLVTVNGQGAPPVRIRLPASGLYEIRLGTYYGHTAWVQAALAVSSGGRTFTRVRLSGDEHWDTVEAEHYGPREGGHPEKQVKLNEMFEVRWRVARLEGSELEIAPVDRKFAEGTLASLAYVRLVPLDEVQYRTEMPRPDTKRLVAVFDGTFYGNFPKDEEEIWGYFEPMRGSDFSLVFWATCRLDACYYLSEVGRPLTPLPEGILNRRTYILRDFQRWVERKVDPLEVAVDAAHELGLEIYGSMRLMGVEIPPFHQFHGAPTFMTEHPEFWTVDASGHKVPHLSLAFPEVRNLIVRLFREQAQRYGIDGVHILFNRSFPFVLFEEPFVRDFVEKYGEDPRNLDPSDPRLWVYHGPAEGTEGHLGRCGKEEGQEARDRRTCYEQPQEQPILRAGRSTMGERRADRPPGPAPLLLGRGRRKWGSDPGCSRGSDRCPQGDRREGVRGPLPPKESSREDSEEGPGILPCRGGRHKLLGHLCPDVEEERMVRHTPLWTQGGAGEVGR